MVNTLKIVNDISEQEAFFNCVKILDNFELHVKQFAFTENYIKWLLNKFQMPFVFLEPFEDIPPDEIPENTAAFAQSQKNLISVPIKSLNLGTLYKHLGFIAHELAHVSNDEFFISRLLLGKDRTFYHEPFTEDTWQKAKTDEIDRIDNDANFLHSIAYYLNPHEMSSRENEWFYTNMFLRLAKNFIKNPFSAKAINNQLEECLKRADEVSSHESLLHTYTLCSIIFEDTKKKILKEMLRLLKQLQKIKTGDANSYCEVKEQLFALVSLFPNKALAKKLVKTFIKSDKYSFGLVLQSDSLELLSKIPHEALTEKEINAFLTKRMFLAEYLIKSIEPETLAERFLLLNGTNSLNVKDFEECSEIKKHLAIINKVANTFGGYYIVGINNMPESKAKQQALKNFINTKNFKLTPEVLEEYNKIFDGNFYYEKEKLPPQKTLERI